MSISIRELRLEDAPYMHEWMRDMDVLKGLQPELFINLTIEDCNNFIISSKNNVNDCHMAIVDENDVYQGTISLKMIDPVVGDCEFAIVLRKSAQGKGYAKDAIMLILKVAFVDLNLNEVYWNVLKNNIPAIRLYKKCGFHELEVVSERRKSRAPHSIHGDIEDVIFFHILKREYLEKTDYIIR